MQVFKIHYPTMDELLEGIDRIESVFNKTLWNNESYYIETYITEQTYFITVQLWNSIE